MTIACLRSVFILQEPERIIGCTGSPAESHELHWMTLKLDNTPRCPECGSGKSTLSAIA